MWREGDSKDRCLFRSPRAQTKLGYIPARLGHQKDGLLEQQSLGPEWGAVHTWTLDLLPELKGSVLSVPIEPHEWRGRTFLK